jgi:hypothetical protein
LTWPAVTNNLNLVTASGAVYSYLLYEKGLNELYVASFRWESRFPVIGC